MYAISSVLITHASILKSTDMDLWLILYIIDLLLFVVVAMTVAYIFVFSVASLFSQRATVPKAKRQNRFVVLIPAYKADKTILQTVVSVLGQTYPQRMFDVTVISDHQNEMTNMHLAQYPITLITPNFEKSSKAKSLQYAILNLPEFKIYDVVVVIDANNIVEPEFLEQINDAYETAGSKAILVHRLPKNRDTSAARLDSVFEEINNSIFRRGHNVVGLSAALTGSGVAFNFDWFKTNIMKVRSNDEEKEIESMLLRQHIFIDYFDDIHVYDEKTRRTDDFNKQRGRWAGQQIKSLITNIRYIPAALIESHYDWLDKIIQWMLMPRMIMMGIIGLMSIILPFIYFTLVIKWWIIAVIIGFAFALATPNNLVDEHWDYDFLSLPYRTIKSLLRMVGIRLPDIRLPKFKIIEIIKEKMSPFSKANQKRIKL